MESTVLKAFRRKMANPLNWRKGNRILSGYSKQDIATLEGASRFIGELAAALDVELSLTERTEAARWLMKRQMDPASKRDRMMLWKQVK